MVHMVDHRLARRKPVALADCRDDDAIIGDRGRDDIWVSDTIFSNS